MAIEYLPYYNDKEKHRHDVRPGLTGLAQINGRSALKWEDRFEFDINYISNIALINDLKIILITIFKVFKKTDIVEAGQQGDFHLYRMRQWSEKNEKGNR